MKQHELIYEKVLPALQTKMNEIKYYEYNAITIDDLWNYCIAKKWRKKQIEDMHLHEIVSTILSVTPSEIVSYGQVEDFKQTNWLSDLSKDELQYLLHPIQPLELDKAPKDSINTLID